MAPPPIPAPPTALFLAVGVANAVVFLTLAALVRWLWSVATSWVETLVWPAPALDVWPEGEGASGGWRRGGER